MTASAIFHYQKISWPIGPAKDSAPYTDVKNRLLTLIKENPKFQRWAYDIFSSENKLTLRRSPNASMAWAYLGYALRALGDTARADIYFTQAREALNINFHKTVEMDYLLEAEPTLQNLKNGTWVSHSLAESPELSALIEGQIHRGDYPGALAQIESLPPGLHQAVALAYLAQMMAVFPTAPLKSGSDLIGEDTIIGLDDGRIVTAGGPEHLAAIRANRAGAGAKQPTPIAFDIERVQSGRVLTEKGPSDIHVENPTPLGIWGDAKARHDPNFDYFTVTDCQKHPQSETDVIVTLQSVSGTEQRITMDIAEWRRLNLKSPNSDSIPENPSWIVALPKKVNLF